MRAGIDRGRQRGVDDLRGPLAAPGVMPGQVGASVPRLRTRLNDLRRRHRALRQLRGLTVHRTDDDAILCFSKRAGDDVVIVVVNVDPHRARETIVHLDMPELGLDWDATFTAYDEIGDRTWAWREHNYVRLDPHDEPAHVVVVRGEPDHEGER